MGMANKAMFFDTGDPLGEVGPLGHLVPYRPSTEDLLSSIKALGLRLACITHLPDNQPDDRTSSRSSPRRS